jgi:hypothetical protein
MLRGVMRRISTLERAIPIPMTAAIFLDRAEAYARRSETSFEAALESLARAVSNDELERLTSEFEQIAFGGDIAARDAAKRRTLMLVDSGALA